MCFRSLARPDSCVISSYHVAARMCLHSLSCTDEIISCDRFWVKLYATDNTNPDRSTDEVQPWQCAAANALRDCMKSRNILNGAFAGTFDVC